MTISEDLVSMGGHRWRTTLTAIFLGGGNLVPLMILYWLVTNWDFCSALFSGLLKSFGTVLFVLKTG